MLQDILSAHFSAYPQMEPADAVKLVYQHVFGPEHMIRDPQKALTMLRQEMAALTPGKPGEPLYEAIGNGLCRLNLRPCLQKGIPAEMICDLFCDAAAATKGNPRAMEQGLRTLAQMADEDETPFDPAALDLYLILYREKGCPAVHHSDAYRAAYAPAYRVVAQKKLKDALAAWRRDQAGTPAEMP